MNKKSRSGRTTVNASKASAGYIISPAIDFWLTGGVSIIVMLLLLCYIALQHPSSAVDKTALLGNAFIFQALINWPHFMGAYGLLYRPLNNVGNNRLAAIYVPFALLSLVGISVLTGEGATWTKIRVNQDIAYFIWLGAAFYLAWHYTGQAWGMIATFLRLSNAEVNPAERMALRIGLRMLLAWHVIWGAQDLPKHWLGELHHHIPALLNAMNVLCILAFIAGISVWLNVKKRYGKTPDARVLASWVSIYLWYLVLYFMPSAYILVQMSHALQYLAFPLRVELNRIGSAKEKKKEIKQMAWSIRYYLVLLISGLIAFYLPIYASDQTQQFTFAFVIASVISIHHYFVDGCIWRIGNPIVRKQLFAHLPGLAK